MNIISFIENEMLDRDFLKSSFLYSGQHLFAAIAMKAWKFIALAFIEEKIVVNQTLFI